MLTSSDSTDSASVASLLAASNGSASAVMPLLSSSLQLAGARRLRFLRRGDGVLGSEARCRRTRAREETMAGSVRAEQSKPSVGEMEREEDDGKGKGEELLAAGGGREEEDAGCTAARGWETEASAAVLLHPLLGVKVNCRPAPDRDV